VSGHFAVHVNCGGMISAPQPGVSLPRACAAVLRLPYWLARCTSYCGPLCTDRRQRRTYYWALRTAAGWAVAM
jgi:hypothetical protein